MHVMACVIHRVYREGNIYFPTQFFYNYFEPRTRIRSVYESQLHLDYLWHILELFSYLCEIHCYDTHKLHKSVELHKRHVFDIVF